MEDLRQICLYNLSNRTWWDYSIRFSKQCMNTTDLKTCSEKIYQELGYDKSKLEQCIRKSFGGSDDFESDNNILAAERQLFLGEGIQIWPSIRINNITYRVKTLKSIKPSLFSLKKTGQFGAFRWCFRCYLRGT